MAVTSDTRAGQPPPPGPAAGRARGRAGLGLLKRFLTLREGSIIVVTLITIIYFAATTSNFLTVQQLQVAASVLHLSSRSWRRGRCS